MFGSVGDQLRQEMSQLVDTLALMVERHHELVESDSVDEVLRRVVQELGGHGVPALRLEAACIRLLPEWRVPVLERIETDMGCPDVRVAVDALLAMDLVAQRADAEEADVARLLRAASQMISWQREEEAWAGTVDLTGSVLKRHPRLLVDDVERWVLVGLERVAGQTGVPGRSVGKMDSDAGPADKAEAMTRLFVRRAGAGLAAWLFRHYRGLGGSIPEGVRTWERICGSENEFAEVRNEWVGSLVE